MERINKPKYICYIEKRVKYAKRFLWDGVFMHIDLFQKYLIAINILAFCIFTIDYVKYLQSGTGITPEWICDITAILGGSVGTLIAFLVWDKKVNKRNVGWRIFAICMFIIHVIIYAFVYGILGKKIQFEGFRSFFADCITFFTTHKLFLYYYGIINLITFIAFAVDKVRAIKEHWRLSEFTLLLLCLAGGAIGGLIAMFTMRHKTQKAYFRFLLPFMILIHIVVLLYYIIRFV